MTFTQRPIGHRIGSVVWQFWGRAAEGVLSVHVQAAFFVCVRRSTISKDAVTPAIAPDRERTHRRRRIIILSGRRGASVDAPVRYFSYSGSPLILNKTPQQIALSKVAFGREAWIGLSRRRSIGGEKVPK